jgi:hypothetical protein
MNIPEKQHCAVRWKKRMKIDVGLLALMIPACLIPDTDRAATTVSNGAKPAIQATAQQSIGAGEGKGSVPDRSTRGHAAAQTALGSGPRDASSVPKAAVALPIRGATLPEHAAVSSWNSMTQFLAASRGLGALPGNVGSRQVTYPAVIGGAAEYNAKNGAVIGGALATRKR